jgi:hypothetical protein
VPSFCGLFRIRPVTDQMRFSTFSEGIFLFQVRSENLIRTGLVYDRPHFVEFEKRALIERPYSCRR